MQKIIKYESDSKYEQEFKDNLNECKREFNLTFNNNNNNDSDENSSGVCCVAAPGRVNLIGEHIDYNDGYVLPMAIPLYTIIAGNLNHSPQKQCRIKSLESSLGQYNCVEFCIDDLKQQTDANFKWANYLIGVVANFKGTKHSFDAVIKSNVPLGSGLSSSAALEVAMYTFLENISNGIVIIYIIIFISTLIYKYIGHCIWVKNENSNFYSGSCFVQCD
jgi:galactokinase